MSPEVEVVAQRKTARKTYIQSLIEVVSDAILVVTREGVVDFASPSCSRVLGLEPAKLAGQDIRGLIHAGDVGLYATALSALPSDDSPPQAFHLRFGAAADGWREVDATARLFSLGGGPPRVLLSLRPGALPGTEQEEFRLLAGALERTRECVLAAGPDGTVRFVNRAFEETTGLKRQAVLGHRLDSLRSERHQDDYFAQLRECFRTGFPFEGPHEMRRSDGTTRTEERRILPPDAAGGAFLFVAQDATARAGSAQALGDLTCRLDLLFRGASDGLWDWDLRAGAVHLSVRLKEFLGCADQEIGEAPEDWFGLIHPEDVEEFKVKIHAHLEGLSPFFEHEHRMVHRSGGIRWVLTRGLAARDAEGRATRIAGSQKDITAQKQAEEQSLHDAFHDALTGLPNRALFLDRLGQSLARGRRREDQRFALLFMDLDRFKIVNDSLGHRVGDLLLVEMARRLEGALRPADTVARLGGDEFAILLEDIRDVRDATGFAERIQKDLRAPFYLEGREVFSTVSVGIAISGPAYDRPEDLLRDADTAMYRAKGLGRSRHAVFDKAMHTNALALLQLETDLRRAVEQNAFRLVYQPIILIKTGRTAGFEALVRWLHPKRGFVPPAEFVPLAEETGLIIPIGNWILREAFRQLRAWQSVPSQGGAPPVMSVNLSGVQFMRPELITNIDGMIREYGVQAKNLKLELTESVIIENAEYARDMLLQIKSLDIRLCIDDFGTGYSSMSYLRRYPIDTVKVDKSFISRMDSDAESQEIVKTIITMAHNLGKDVIAEGVETREQLGQIRALKCEYAQGYYFSRPVDGEAAELMINRKWTL